MDQIRALEELGKRIPDRLMPPEVPPGYDDWIEAFVELGTDRQLGQVAGPIPASSIDRHTAGWPDAEAAVFRRVMRAMDHAYLTHGDDDAEIPASDNPARDAFRARMR